MNNLYHDTPLVSVVMSVYNSENTINEAIDSIVGQTLSNIELIIINDGSTDLTSKLIDEYVVDPRLKIINQDNNGLTKSLIRAVNLSRGKYIARQDADDVSYSERLEKQFNYLESNPDVALLGTQSVQIDKYGEKLGNIVLSTTYKEIYSNVYTSNQFVHGSVMMRKDAYVALGGYRSVFRFSQDYDLFLRIIEKYRAENMPEFLYKSRHNLNMISLTNKGEQKYYAECAKILFKERRNNSVDQLDKYGSLPDVPRYESQNYTVIYYQHLISSFLRKGNLLKVRKYSLSLLKISPLNIHTWLVLIFTFLGRKVVMRTSSLIDNIRAKRNST